MSHRPLAPWALDLNGQADRAISGKTQSSRPLYAASLLPPIPLVYVASPVEHLNFGHPRSELSAVEVKDFEDFIMWRLVELSAKYELPFQIHTGHGRIQGSNPMNLVDLIEANPRTTFILFHGGFPWVGETGIILMRHAPHVWLDSVWMPTLSYATAKRAFHEWLDVMPSSRIMWGGDANHCEGIYGATEMTRRCLAEVLTEKVDRGDLREEHAHKIGRQVLRDNALALIPQLKDRLWKHKGISMKPPVPAVPQTPAR